MLIKSNKTELAIFSFGRKNSERCHNKMLRDFSGTTLTDIVLNKLSKLKYSTFFAGYEKKFKDKCFKHKIPFVQRSKDSANIDKPIIQILNFLKNQNFKKFIIINSCVPFLEIKTINKFINFCLKNPDKPAFSIIKKKNFYINKEFIPINFSKKLQTINTKETSPIYEFAHSLYYFDKDFFFKNKRYWNYSSLRYFEIKNKIEQFDIDTEEDFYIAKILKKKINEI
jgi:CMP-N-acetylneuraminic acid synthetase